MGTVVRFPSHRSKYLYGAILALGLAAAVVVYVAAPPAADNPLGYDPMDSKKYLHDLEMYGGKANVMAAEFREWFVGLWHGRNLAYTIAVLTVLLVVAMRFVASVRAMPAVEEGEESPELPGSGPGSGVG